MMPDFCQAATGPPNSRLDEKESNFRAANGRLIIEKIRDFGLKARR
jgi:hypothetical protein